MISFAAKLRVAAFQYKRKFSMMSGSISLDQIPTWSEYYEANSDRLQKLDKSLYINKFSIVMAEKRPDLNKLVSLWKGDITKLQVDAIVNAANNTLLGGSGVDGAIHKAAGRSLYDECKTLNGCRTGDAKVTGGYNLPAKHVIHTVGPVGENPIKLESCYATTMERMAEYHLKSVAFPCISTGVYGYPHDSAAHVALKIVRQCLENDSSVNRVIFCLFLERDFDIYETMMQLYFPV